MKMSLSWEAAGFLRELPLRIPPEGYHPSGLPLRDGVGGLRLALVARGARGYGEWFCEMGLSREAAGFLHISEYTWIIYFAGGVFLYCERMQNAVK